MAVLVLAGCAGEPAARSPGGTILFDGTSLAGWRVVEEGPFRRHGDVTLAGGAVRLAPGKPLTGIAWAGDVPRCGYEVSFEARRTAGSDFFCGLTFPVGNAHCTWIVGG